MKEEFGKWLMDIAKYVATAVVLSSIFGVIETQWIVIALGIAAVLSTLLTGLWLVKDKKQEE